MKSSCGVREGHLFPNLKQCWRGRVTSPKTKEPVAPLPSTHTPQPTGPDTCRTYKNTPHPACQQCALSPHPSVDPPSHPSSKQAAQEFYKAVTGALPGQSSTYVTNFVFPPNPVHPPPPTHPQPQSIHSTIAPQVWQHPSSPERGLHPTKQTPALGRGEENHTHQ